VLAVIGRPLLFLSIDPVLAAARRVPVTLVSTAFLVVLGLAATATAQVTGSLLVFSLLVAPAATAHRLTARPARGIALSVAIGLLTVWLGIASAYYLAYPVGFWVATYGFAAYALTLLTQAASQRLARRSRPAPSRTQPVPG
jgi:zinc/manganese transport system permease protein